MIVVLFKSRNTDWTLAPAVVKRECTCAGVPLSRDPVGTSTPVSRPPGSRETLGKAATHGRGCPSTFWMSYCRDQLLTVQSNA